MSLMNYIFTTGDYGLDTSAYLTRKRPTMQASSPENGSTGNGTAPAKSAGENSFVKSLLKTWKYISVEPILICWIVPSLLFFIGAENLNLEKSCRVNFGYSDEVCDNMIDKSKHDINCVNVREKLENKNEIHLFPDRSEVLNDTHYANGTSIMLDGANQTILFDLTKLERDVCHAEVESQKLDTQWNAYLSPVDLFAGPLMILFAGGWSDRNGKRKPCMILPLIGELMNLIALLIAVVFFKQLPVQFTAILSKVLPAIFGSGLMLLGVFSYLSATTPEEDRTFRFNLFAQAIVITPIIFIPMAGPLFTSLGYVKLLLLCIPINLAGLLYAIFVLKEVEPNDDSVDEKSGIDNPGFDNVVSDATVQVRETQNGHRISVSAPAAAAKKNFLVDFFNPIVAVQCVRVLMRKRKNSSRAIILLLIFIYFVTVGPALGESQNEYAFVRYKLNWDGTKYGNYYTFGNVATAIGCVIMTTVLSKMFKIPDPLLAVIGGSFSAISRLIYIFVTSSVMMYVGRLFDSFVVIRGLVVRSVLSKCVEADELGSIFSITGIVDAIAGFIFVLIYSLIYEKTVDTWTGAFYFVTFLAIIVSILLFVCVQIIMNRTAEKDVEQKLEMKDAVSDLKPSPATEITHM